MNELRCAAFFLSFCVLALGACGSDDDDAGSSTGGTGGSGGTSTGGTAGSGGTSATGGGAGASGQPTCTARFAWLQKDAYLESAGRNYDFWPPHTTTTLKVTCDGDVVADAVMANHGTRPEDVDAEGVPILDEVLAEQHDGPRDQLLQLVDAFEACECGTTFLSLDALDAQLVEEMVAELAAYVIEHLTCPNEGGVDAIVDALTTGDIAYVVDNAPSCSWSSDDGWEGGLDAALDAVAAVTQDTLADYHVCNNDAMLQAILWDGYKLTGKVTACDGSNDVCAGPKWLYSPQSPK
jgi:hypothetical protein